MIGIDEVQAPDGPCLQVQAGEVFAARGLLGGVAANRTAGQLATLVL